MTKFLPAIFVPYFILKGRWRAAMPAVVVIAVVAGIAQLALGWQHNYVMNLLLNDDPFLDTPLNQSATGPILRLMRGVGLQHLGIDMSQLMILALAIPTALVMLRFRARGHWKVEWAFLSLAMIMLLPHNQNYYLMFLLIPYAILTGMIFEGQLRGAAIKWLVGASFFLTGWPIPLTIIDRLIGQSSAELFRTFAIPVVGVALLVVALLIALRQTAAPPARQQEAVVGPEPVTVSA
jgi:hypothetical protein